MPNVLNECKRPGCNAIATQATEDALNPSLSQILVGRFKSAAYWPLAMFGWQTASVDNHCQCRIVHFWRSKNMLATRQGKIGQVRHPAWSICIDGSQASKCRPKLNSPDRVRGSIRYRRIIWRRWRLFRKAPWPLHASGRLLRLFEFCGQQSMGSAANAVFGTSLVNPPQTTSRTVTGIADQNPAVLI